MIGIVFFLLVALLESSISFRTLAPRRAWTRSFNDHSLTQLSDAVDAEKFVITEAERKELWKNISNLEKRAVDALSAQNVGDSDRDEALKLFAQSVSTKNNDPFIQLAVQYNDALARQDAREAERIFTSMKLVGLPPHLNAIVRKTQNSLTIAAEVVDEDAPEDLDPGSTFSDTVTENIRVKVSSFYDPQKSDPANGKYMFWYKVAIYNEGPEPVQVVARMWEIEKCKGEKEVIRGAGIIGSQPIVPPGEVFTYQSVCPLKVFPPKGRRVIGSMSGAYTMCKGNMGQHNFTVKVSKFNLILPANAASA